MLSPIRTEVRAPPGQVAFLVPGWPGVCVSTVACNAVGAVLGEAWVWWLDVGVRADGVVVLPVGHAVCQGLLLAVICFGAAQCRRCW